MPNYRRNRVKGGCYFFTVNLTQRGSTVLTDNIDHFRAAYAEVQAMHPFQTEAIVIMPDHLHTVWQLPKGDADYSTRWKKIKAGFSKRIGHQPCAYSKQSKGEAGVWQRRFWEHTIRDGDDWRAHIAYVLNNPVKHGFVEDAKDWPFSSIHRDLKNGIDWRT